MIELASVIKDLRDELEQAIVAAEDKALRFELGPIELEVSVALERRCGSGWWSPVRKQRWPAPRPSTSN